jgi:hypothetical protein
MREVSVPFNFKPRDYQLPFFKAMDNGYKRAVLLFARRHGKDKCTFCYMIKAMLERVGNYAYIFPTASLARKAAWQNIDSDGFKLLDHIPAELIVKKQDQSMHIELTNGSTLTFFGSDRQISVGTAFCGIAFSEFALQDKTAFDLLRPVVMQNNGFMIINSTPRGRNHYYDLWKMAEKNEKWYSLRVTADDSNVFSKEDIQSERDSGLSEEVVQQEFYCSFTRGVEGSFYGKHVDTMRKENRIGSVYDNNIITYAAFDLGISDSTAITVWQQVGQEIHVIDHYENNNEPLEHYVRWLKDKPYVWGEIYLPHDAKVRELGTGLSRVEVFRNLGINPRIVPSIGLMEGIDVVRKTLKRCWIDEKKCNTLIQSLEMYHREYNTKFGVYADRPVHDKYSNSADSFRYMCIAISQMRNRSGVSDISCLNRKNALRI